MIQKHQFLNKEIYLGGTVKKKTGGEEWEKLILKSTKHVFVNCSGAEGVVD